LRRASDDCSCDLPSNDFLVHSLVSGRHLGNHNDGLVFMAIFLYVSFSWTCSSADVLSSRELENFGDQ
jgi:hypothetical protein